MIDGLVIEAVALGQDLIAAPIIRVDAGALFHKLGNVRRDVARAAILNVTGHNVTIPFDHAEDHGLIVASFAGVLATDEGFVRFHDLAGTANWEIPVNVAHVFANQIAHAPRGFVGDAQLALHLFRRHAVPRSAEQEHDVEPVPKAGPGLFEGRPGGRVDLIAAMLTGEAAAGFDAVERRFLVAAHAGQALAVAGPHQVIKAGSLIRETGLKLADFGRFLSHLTYPHTG